MEPSFEYRFESDSSTYTAWPLREQPGQAKPAAAEAT